MVGAENLSTMKKVEVFEPEIGFELCSTQSFQEKQLTGGGFRLAICLTLFNEPANLLQASMESIVESLDALGHKNSDFRLATVCIIADGQSHLSVTSQAYLQTLGFKLQALRLDGFEGEIELLELDTSQSMPTIYRQNPSPMKMSIQLVKKTHLKRCVPFSLRIQIPLASQVTS